MATPNFVNFVRVKQNVLFFIRELYSRSCTYDTIGPVQETRITALQITPFFFARFYSLLTAELVQTQRRASRAVREHE